MRLVRQRHPGRHRSRRPPRPPHRLPHRPAPAPSEPTSAATSAGTASGSESASAPAESSGSGSAGSSPSSLPPAKLTLLFGSSGTAETNAVKAAASAWGESSRAPQSGHRGVEPHPAARSGILGGTPPDVFYLDAGRFANYAKVGAARPTPTAEQARTSSQPERLVHLRRQALLRAEGLLHARPGDQHRPVEQGRADRRRLPDQLGPARGGREEADHRPGRPGRSAPATGSTRSCSRTAAAGQRGPRVDRRLSRRTSTALTYVQRLLADGVLKFPKELDAGWGGEAFGKNKAAMTIEGNWIIGAMTATTRT